jgi:Na+/H+ antiporter NhaD/arsenite permease-like protein
MALFLGAAEHYAPHIAWIAPFVAILLAIAILPLVPQAHHWWERNRHKLLVALVLAAITLLYYGFRSTGVTQHGVAAAHTTAPGWSTVGTVLSHAVIAEYLPFILLLFSLYVIAGGIVVRGDLRATPAVNTAILAAGAALASLIGTTGAAMVLIRFLLKTNSERTRKVHTVVFFIFLVANIGGSLLPIGDPPLFLGYLLGVDFFWTLRLWPQWACLVAALLVIYYAWDRWAYQHEPPEAIRLDTAQRQPMQIAGLVNVVWLLGVVVAVAALDPSKPLPGTQWHAFPYLRELVQLAMAGLSLLTTQRALRRENQFNYAAIAEVACLFIGIFITMQVPIEILQAKGPELGLRHAWHFFWASGGLSSFLDNAPTYVVYFAAAGTLAPPGMALVHNVQTATGSIPLELLVAISCGSVFMGANTYIGNGPNFMVKAIAEQSGVKMPTFFGYMAYSCGILLPLFVLLTLVFFRG